MRSGARRMTGCQLLRPIPPGLSVAPTSRSTSPLRDHGLFADAVGPPWIAATVSPQRCSTTCVSGFNARTTRELRIGIPGCEQETKDNNLNSGVRFEQELSTVCVRLMSHGAFGRVHARYMNQSSHTIQMYGLSSFAPC